jgi:hypothetical protein
MFQISVPTWQIYIYVTITSEHLIMLRETITVYSENHTEHVNKFCGQNTEFINGKANGTPTYSNKYDLKG